MSHHEPLQNDCSTPQKSSPSVRLGFLVCMFAASAALVSCGGGGSGNPTPSPPPSGIGPTPPSPPPSPSPPSPPFTGAVNISGTATFESVPASSTGGLDYTRRSFQPVRGAQVELINASGATLATTTTSAAGTYSFSLPSAQTVAVRVRAEIKNSNVDFTVRDNTNDGALYTMVSSNVTPTSADTIINVAAPSGWGGSSYTSARVAGPFAILDVAYKASLLVVGARPNIVLPSLRLFWSPNNRAAGSATDIAQVRQGNIGTSSFVVRAGQAELYLLGDDDADTDEYDQPVVAHEIGHFMQHAVSRDDSSGGPHRVDQLLDMRLAFSEGWGYGWAGMVLGSPIMHDSALGQQASGFTVDISRPPNAAWRGWFNEGTVQYLIWTQFSDPNIGFNSILNAIAAMRESPVFTTIYSFNHYLIQAVPSAESAIVARSNNVGVTGTGLFGVGETNAGGLASSLPVYKRHLSTLGASQTYCVTSEGVPSGTDVRNKLGAYTYIRFTASGARTIRINRASNTTATTDPDLVLIMSNGRRQVSESAVENSETLSVTLPSGEHVLGFNDYNLTASGATRCFDVRID